MRLDAFPMTLEANCTSFHLKSSYFLFARTRILPKESSANHILFYFFCCLSSRIKKQEQQEWTDGVCASTSVCCCQFVRLLTVAVAVCFFRRSAATNTHPASRSALLCSSRICSRGRFGVGAIWSGHCASCSSERDSGREAPRDAIKAVFHFQPLWVEHNC